MYTRPNSTPTNPSEAGTAASNTLSAFQAEPAKLTVKKNSNIPGLEWRARLSDGRSGVSYYGSTMDEALEKIRKATGTTLVAEVLEGNLQPITVGSTGTGRNKRHSYGQEAR